ncbi:type II and III secretion system protein family protein [Bradyrhizobium cenepequi]|uniref:type II and III secretion system protein family protein n=1 Tax=Bradyrhizobium cenepequi TaxID=2821403 RepID=UPI001CE3573C|nr:type II and III secretion system protein family protein [Bradyrhizobium cenepequi]MCA6105778.1 type II and III secretion system protein family protein [Bradyrhizobium cenepequi]
MGSLDAQTVQSGRGLPGQQAGAVVAARPRAPATAPRNAPAKMSGRLDITISRGETIHLPGPATNMFVADPTIADIQTPSNETIFVFGKRAGRTSLFALDARGEALAEFQVVVTQPIEDLRALLRSEVGDYPISVSYTPNGAVLSGLVPNAAVAESAKAVALQFLGNGAIVSNRLKVAGATQVNLNVRVAEVSRSAMKALGINLNAFVRAGNFTFGLVNPSPPSGGGQFGVGYVTNDVGIGAVLDALAQEKLVTILAEPNLTTVSGEPASFLAGGEFPIPVSQGLNQISVEFRKFGASLEFVPTVLSGNLINIRVKPEVSELSSQGAIVINNFSVPALSTRRAETVVELASGQSFAIGGLIRRNFNTNIQTFPWLGDVPIIGALFRSSQFQKEETELVIIVTPYLVRPSPAASAMQAPTDRVGPPTDAGRILFNTLTKPPRGRVAPATSVPGITGEAGFLIE